MTDIALIQVDPGSFDLGIDAPDIATDEGLQTVVTMYLFTDVGEWWGDKYFDRPLGSELYKLDAAKATQQTLNQAEADAYAALKPLIDDGVVQDVEVTAEYGGTHQDILGLSIIITRPDGSDATFEYNHLWEGQLNG